MQSGKEKNDVQPCFPPLVVAADPLAARLVRKATDGRGQVTKIDKSAGKITINHGPIKNLDMDGMTMVFRAQDPAMLAGQARRQDRVRGRPRQRARSR